MFSFRLIIAISFGILTLSLSACAHSVGGKSVNDVFKDRQSLKLASSACRGEHVKIRDAVAEGADVNATGLDDVSILIWALSCKNLVGIQALLDNGANPNHGLKFNLNPVSIAASYEDRTDILKAVVDAGGNVNAVSGSYQETALITAFIRGVDTGRWENYYYLLEAGADVNFETDSGRNIGVVAASFNRYCKLIELIDKGYNLDLEGTLVGSKKIEAASVIRDDASEKKCLVPLIEKLERRFAEAGRR